MTPLTYSISKSSYAHNRNQLYSWFLICLFLTPVTSAWAQDTLDYSDIVVNEILYFQDTSNIDENLDHEWAELYNSGTDTIDLENWTISNRDGAALVTLPHVIFPPNTYLVVHFREGIDDLDLTDGAGDYYSQDSHLAIDNFSSTLDELALYKGDPSSENIVDFVAWKASDQDFAGGLAYDFAIAAGIWNEDDFFDGENSSGRPGQKISRTHIGTSIGRDEESNDDDVSQDWAIDGGANAIDITPRAQNLSNLQMIIPQPLPPPSPKSWTFMVYLDGDNDLEEFAWQDLNEMEVVSADDDVNVVVMVDWIPNYSNVRVSLDNGNTFNPTSTAYRGYLLKDDNKKRVYLYPAAADNPVLGEKNMGDPNVLSEFIQWGMDKFPANNYAVVIWDHGLGWKTTTYDDSSDDELHMGELRDALKPFPKMIDLLGFDQCLMAMVEVALQVSEGAHVMVASEELEDGDGWPYDKILTDLKNNPKWSANALGKSIVDNFHFYYENTVIDRDHTLSAIALNDKFKNLVNQISGFGAELTTGIEDYKRHFQQKDNVQLKIREDLLKTKKFDDQNYIDLVHFAKLIKNNGGIPIDYKNNARPIINNMLKGAGVVIAEKHNLANNPNVHGLSIYFPEYQTKKVNFEISEGDTIWVDPFDDPWDSFITDQASDQVKYASDPDDCIPLPDPSHHPLEPTPNFLFPQQTLWDEFLHRYYEPVADAGEDLVVFVGEKFMLNGSGSSDADGNITHYYWDMDNTISTDDDDYDRNCVDDLDDDNDYDTIKVMHTYWQPGVYCVTLNVWDDHHLQPGHSKHQETDDDEVKITVLPIFHDPDEFYHDVIGGGASQLIDEEGMICFDWTLGEWVIESFDTPDGLALSQGFHQGYGLTVSVDDPKEHVEIQVYPNPTNAFVHINSRMNESIFLEVHNSTGNLMLVKTIEAFTSKDKIDMSSMPSGLYVLSFRDEKGVPLSSFKILKSL